VKSDFPRDPGLRELVAAPLDSLSPKLAYPLYTWVNQRIGREFEDAQANNAALAAADH
jgi:hypothetical protein